jgi:hypothetical protein
MLKQYKKTTRDLWYNIIKYKSSDSSKEHINEYSYPYDLQAEKDKHEDNRKSLIERANVLKFTGIKTFIKTHQHLTYAVQSSIFFGVNKLMPSKDIPKFTIIKNSFVTGDVFFEYLFVCVFLDLYNIIKNNKYKVCAVSRHYALLETCLFNNVVCDHYYYERENDNVADVLRKNMKEKYEFNDTKLEDTISGSYDIILWDCGLEVFNDGLPIEQILNKDKNNASLLMKLYNNLDALNDSGYLFIKMFSCITREHIIVLQNIVDNFEKVTFINDITLFSYVYCKNYKKTYNKNSRAKWDDNIKTDFYEKIKKIYKLKFKKHEEIVGRSLVAKSMYDNINEKNNEERLKQMYIRTLYIAQYVSKFAGLDTYDINVNEPLSLSNNMQRLITTIKPQLYEIESHTRELKLEKNNNYNNYIIESANTQLKKTLNNINFMKQHLYDKFDEFLLFRETSLIKSMFDMGVSIDGKPTNNQWINMNEILRTIRFRKMNKKNSYLKILFIGENNGSNIYATTSYIGRKMPKIEFEWSAIVNKDYTDDYGLLNKNKAEIINPIDVKTIKNYKNKHNIMASWIINSYEPQDKIMFIRLYYAQILFILENLKHGGNCIIKCHIPIHEKIIIDLYYIMYVAFEKILIVRPTLSMSKPEFYIVGINYDNMLINKKQLNILYEIIEEPTLNDISVINKYPIEFENTILHYINMIYNDYCEYVKSKIFYVDLWEQINNSVEQEIKKSISQTNYLYIKKMFKQT